MVSVVGVWQSKNDATAEVSRGPVMKVLLEAEPLSPEHLKINTSRKMGNDSPAWLWILFIGADFFFLIRFFSLSALNTRKSNQI